MLEWLLLPYSSVYTHACTREKWREKQGFMFKNEQKNRNQALNHVSIYRRIVSVSPSVSADLETNALSHFCLSLLEITDLPPGSNHSCLANTLCSSWTASAQIVFTSWHHQIPVLNTERVEAKVS